MKKILAIILVVAMVLVPVSVLAETITTPAPITITEKVGKGVYTYKDASGAVVPANLLMSGTSYNLYIAPAAGYRVVSVAANAAGATTTALTVTPNTGYWAITNLLTSNAGLTVTYAKNAYVVKGAVVNTDGKILDTAGFGAVTGSSSAVTGYLTLEASIKNAYFTGNWYVGTDTSAAFTAIGATTGQALQSSTFGIRKITVDLAEVAAFAGAAYNGPVYIAAEALQVTAVVAADVATNCQGYGKVSVQWLTATSVKVTATANKGAKFVGWQVAETNLLGTAAIGDISLYSPVLYVTDIEPETNLKLEAYFIITSGDFTTGTTDATGGKSDNPKTGDASNIALWTIVGIIALGGVALASKKVFSK